VSDPEAWIGLKDLLVDLIHTTTAVVERSHRRALDRPLRLLRALPTGREHAAVADLGWELYASANFRSVRGISWALGEVAGGALTLLGRVRRPRSPLPTPMRSDAMWSRPWWRDQVQGTLNGVFGDRLRAAGNPLEISMGFRRDGAPLPLEGEALRDALPQATGRVCVFVHGMCTTEWSWILGAAASHGDPRTSYGTRLARDLGFTPLYLRYNTGLHVSENGEELAELLDALLAAYPRPIEELVLVGHSMGGLVVRSACHQAAGRPWLERLSRIVCLATPHHGSPLEKLGSLTTALLDVWGVPATEIPAELLKLRSAGLKDLRYGNLLHDDWRGRDPDALLEDTRRPPPPLDGVATHRLAASFTHDPRHPVGRLLGDFMVRVSSAAGSPEAEVLGGLDHYAVLNDPRVYERLRAWCALGRATA